MFPAWRRVVVLAAASLWLAVGATMALAAGPTPPATTTLPTNPSVVNGSATFSTQGSTYIVNQNVEQRHHQLEHVQHPVRR